MLVLRMLARNASRIREWNIVISSNHFLSSSKSQRRGSHVLGAGTLRWTGPVPEAAMGFLCESAALHSLSLKVCPLLPRATVLANLSELTIRNSTSARPSATDWLKLFNYAPRLAFLSLHNAVASHEGKLTPTAYQQVSLPNLRFISLGDDAQFSPLLFLFLHLGLSPSCGIELLPPPNTDLARAQRVQPVFEHVASRHVRGNTVEKHIIPLLELAIRPHASPRRCMSFGTVSDPHRNLDWNSDKGSSHLKTLVKDGDFPAYSVCIANPDHQHFLVGPMMFPFLFSGTKLRVIIDDPSAAQELYPDLFTRSLPSLLKEMGNIQELTLTEDIIVQVLSAIVGQLIVPDYQSKTSLMKPTRKHISFVPILAELKTVVIEGVTKEEIGKSELGMLKSYSTWREMVGYPIEEVRFKGGGTITRAQVR